jgi:hypothetical protein
MHQQFTTRGHRGVEVERTDEEPLLSLGQLGEAVLVDDSEERGLPEDGAQCHGGIFSAFFWSEPAECISGPLTAC